MKLSMQSLYVAVAAMLLLAPAALAGQREGAFTLSPMVGYHVFEGDQNTDDAASYGLAFGYNITKHWAVELDARYTPTETDFDTGDNFDIDVWTGSLNALYHLDPDGPFVPYLVAGFGGMVFEVDDSLPGRDQDEDFMLNAGAGLKCFFSEDLALRLDARYIADLHSDRTYDQYPGNDDVDHNLIATAGLVWQFGGPPPAPAAPADSDMDGVPDSRDKCPGTPLGVAVDAVGCPPVPPKPAPAPEVKPAPVVPPPPDPCIGDDDGDGVPNCRDKCPGTEKGIIVNESGCPVKFTLQIEFDFDKAQVRPEYRAKLKEAAEFISKYPGTKFLLAGHTDSKGTDKYNKGLSEQRAAAVKKYLVEQFGIAAHTLHPRGYGESRPIADNATEEGRQKNRRVEVICCIIIPEE